MKTVNPFEAAACFARVRRAMERLNEIFATIAEFCEAFENTPASAIESVEDVTIFFDRLSENLLARTLAIEGLALIDQIDSEVAIYKRDPQVTEIPDLRDAEQLLENIKASAEARRGELEEFRFANERCIENITKVTEQLTGEFETMAEQLKKVMERRGK